MLRAAIRLYAFSNMHMSLCAALFVGSSFLIADSAISKHYILFVFSGTFLIYCFHRLIGLRRIGRPFPSERHSIFLPSNRSFYVLLTGAALLGIYCFWQLDPSYRQHLLWPCLISLLYIVPAFGSKRLRDFDFIKIFCIAFVWSYLFCIPLFVHDVEYSTSILFEKAFFIFALTIPFDIRDREADRSERLRTIGNTLAWKSAITFSFACLLACSAIAIALYAGKIYALPQLTVLVLSYIVSALLIAKSKCRSEFYYLAYLDGMIGLQGVSLLIVG